MIDYEAIKNNVSISTILEVYGVSGYKNSNKYMINCPFHSDSTPSFSVDDRKGLFNCFGCDAGGTVIDLVARFEGITPRSAAEKLSEDFKITPVSYQLMSIQQLRSQMDSWKSGIDANKIKATLPVDVRELPSGYRNVSRLAINHFSLGLVDSGVYIPHYDLAGSVVGYSIRHPDGVMPKYFNTVGFPKSIPYGLYQNKDDIISSGYVIVCEGQFDCIKLWDKGYKNVVSLMGSSMTERQAHILMTITTKLLLFFDGDEPGRKGAAKVMRRWNKCFQIRVVVLQDGLDPADWLDLAETASVSE